MINKIFEPFLFESDVNRYAFLGRKNCPRRIRITGSFFENYDLEDGKTKKEIGITIRKYFKENRIKKQQIVFRIHSSEMESVPSNDYKQVCQTIFNNANNPLCSVVWIKGHLSVRDSLYTLGLTRIVDFHILYHSYYSNVTMHDIRNLIRVNSQVKQFIINIESGLEGQNLIHAFCHNDLTVGKNLFLQFKNEAQKDIKEQVLMVGTLHNETYANIRRVYYSDSRIEYPDVNNEVDISLCLIKRLAAMYHRHETFNEFQLRGNNLTNENPVHLVKQIEIILNQL